jgi:S-adenosylmethionine:tRNA ribosyltransferase-isomerase
MHLHTDQFYYKLPPELIATAPVADRASSRLLVLNRAGGKISHHSFSDLPALLSPGDLLVLNDTKVRPSAMTTIDGTVEILLLEETSPQHWVALVKPGKKAMPGARLTFPGESGPLEAEVLKTLAGGERVFRFFGKFDPHAIAAMPLPPYIMKRRRQMEAPVDCDDRERYQTVYARDEGSVAAPTAGLHFTPELLAGLNHAFLTLHVGLGTFRPVKSTLVRDHEMHKERFSIPAGFAEKAAAAQRLVAVGTTAARVLESVTDLRAQRGVTDIFIYPPYEFKRVGALLTNFHLPQSTLLMLVCAFAGHEATVAAYHEAIAQKYRFYSYGDAMLIL